jgi:hypothetical protein
MLVGKSVVAPPSLLFHSNEEEKKKISPRSRRHFFLADDDEPSFSRRCPPCCCFGIYKSKYSKYSLAHTHTHTPATGSIGWMRGWLLLAFLLLLLLLLLPPHESETTTTLAAALLLRQHTSRLLRVVGYSSRGCCWTATATPSRRRSSSCWTPRPAAHARRLSMSSSDDGGLRAFLRQARSALLEAPNTHGKGDGDGDKDAQPKQRQQQQQQRQLKVVIGNEAADADSIVSALCLAYVLQHTQPGSATPTQYVPVLSLPRAEMQLRPETQLLLRLAGVAEEGDGEEGRHLVFLDEVDLPNLGQQQQQQQQQSSSNSLKVVLVDHNKLCAALQPLEGCVEAIVDHHEDQGKYPWVEGAHREVAFEGGNGNGNGGGLSTASSMASLGGNGNGNGVGMLDGSASSLSLSRSSSTVGRALVASTCTLVAERVRRGVGVWGGSVGVWIGMVGGWVWMNHSFPRVPPQK